VKGHYRNGSWVKGHYRTAPNNSNKDNFSTIGNSNPYTGEPGYIPRDSKLSQRVSTTQNGSSYSAYTNSSYVSDNESSRYNIRSRYRTTNQLKLLKLPYSNSLVVNSIPKGATVELIELLRGDWWEVSYQGESGYVLNEYLKSYRTIDRTLGYSHNYYPAYPNVYTSNPVYETKFVVNLKNSTSNSSTIIEKIPKGESVYVINSSSNSQWQIFYDGKIGYVSRKYLSCVDNKENNSMHLDREINNNNLYSYYYTTTFLNLREQSSASSNIITVIPEFIQVSIIEQVSSNWYRIDYNGIIGYVSSKYLTVSDNIYSRSIERTIHDTYPHFYKVMQATSFRTKPNSQSKVILRFKAGNEVEVLESSDDWWWKVLYNSKVGWVKKRLLRRI
jgi:uncharacterized protein YgiM (DUF1202 family)